MIGILCVFVGLMFMGYLFFVVDDFVVDGGVVVVVGVYDGVVW